MIKALSHIALRTKNLDESLRFYTEVLGLKEAFRLCGDDGKPYLVYLHVSADQFIELFPEGRREVPNERDIIGYRHLCLEVDDVEKSYENLVSLGAPIDSDIKTGNAKCRQFWLHDPDGNQIELMELPSQSMQAQARERYMKKSQESIQ